jgi:hypothetical protein
MEISMQKEIDEELYKICEEISSLRKSVEEWKEIESSDMFQSAHYYGGFEADEEAFWFSFYDEKNNEYYFRLTLEDVNSVLNRQLSSINIRETT